MQTLEKPISQQSFNVKVKKKSHKVRKTILYSFLFVVLTIGGIIGYMYQASLWPATINMSSTCDNMANMHTMSMMQVSGKGTLCSMSSLHQGTIPLTSLTGPATAPHVDTFTLVAQTARLTLDKGDTVDAWTYNGTSPGPTLHARQGDLIVVHLINHLPVPVTIHWHGIRIPNAEDGVAGLTQNAVKPGQSYTYRFIAKDAGTYWYHSHQHSYDETYHGLYGALIVSPAKPTIRDDVDQTLELHDWVFGSFPSFHTVEQVNGTAQTLHIAAKPGQWVRLRIINTGGDHVVTLNGVPFYVSALDGHDLSGPTPLLATPMMIASAERYDLRFQMPASGAVTLFRAASANAYEKTPIVVVGQEGQETAPVAPPTMGTMFDYSNYGTPAPASITIHSHFDAIYTITLSNHLGFINGHFGPIYTFNGQSFPNTPTIMVQYGQLVRLHIVNQSKELHPLHLHGHVFTVLTINGHPLTGSPITLDTISVLPYGTYDIAFYADNPGIWMFHCHNLFHAYMGMDMMIAYPNIYTPFSIGSASGNFPD